jgi:hypothetical protein
MLKTTSAALVASLLIGAAACGSDAGGVAATAKRGDAFCKLADQANADNDALDAVDFTDTAKVKQTMTDAIDSLDAAVAKAPKDIADTADEVLTREEKVETLLKQNGYDFQKLSQTDEGKKALDEIDKSTGPKEFRAYLKDKCGIVSATEDTTGDTTADTTATTEAPVADSTADTTGATTADTSGSNTTLVDLGEGADAINKFLDYYELGVGKTLSDTERKCIVDALVDKVTGDDLNQAISGNPSAELSQALGLAFINCNISMS